MKICAGCRRHVREDMCPFCGSAEDEASIKARDGAGSRLRAKGLAGAAAIAGAASLVDLACARDATHETTTLPLDAGSTSRIAPASTESMNDTKIDAAVGPRTSDAPFVDPAATSTSSAAATPTSTATSGSKLRTGPDAATPRVRIPEPRMVPLYGMPPSSN